MSSSSAALLAALNELTSEVATLYANITQATQLLDDGNALVQEQIMSREIYALLFGGMMCCIGSAGFVFQELGNTSSRHTKHALIKCMLSRTGGLLGFWIIGGALSCGGGGGAARAIAGSEGFLLLGSLYSNSVDDGKNYARWFLEASACQLGISVLSGAAGERATVLAATVMGVIMALFTCPIIQHWSDHADGWAAAPFDDDGSDSRVGTFALSTSSDDALHRNAPLSNSLLAGCGAIDLGSAALHIAGGTTALVVCMVIGPRLGRYNADGTVNEMRRQSVAIQALGVFSMWTAFMFFTPVVAMYRAGSAHVAAKTAVNVAIASGAGGLSATLFGLLALNHADVLTAMTGIMAGIAAIYAGCHVVEAEGAFLVGVTAPPVFFLWRHLFDYFKVDDALDAAAVHMGTGLWGIVCAGLLASPAGYRQAYGSTRAETCCGAFYGCGGAQLGAQIAWGLASTALAGVVGTLAVVSLRAAKKLRVSQTAETEGTDMLLHGGAQQQEHTNVLMKLMSGEVSLNGTDITGNGDGIFSDRKTDDASAGLDGSRRAMSLTSPRHGVKRSSDSSTSSMGNNMGVPDVVVRADRTLRVVRALKKTASASSQGSIGGSFSTTGGGGAARQQQQQQQQQQPETSVMTEGSVQESSSGRSVQGSFVRNPFPERPAGPSPNASPTSSATSSPAGSRRGSSGVSVGGGVIP